MSTQQKRGFRLPWGADRSTDDGAGAATLEADSAEQTAPEQPEDGVVGGELGEGPFHFADVATPDASTDALPEAPEVPETTAEAAMLNTESPITESAESAAPTASDAWPALDRRQAATDETTAGPTAEADGAHAADGPVDGEADTTDVRAPEPPRSNHTPEIQVRPAVKVDADRGTRSNPLVAGLVKAMREAALASREETTARLRSDATGRVELIREAGTSDAADLRKRADEDIAGIREWSKTEIARIKQETDDRIEARKTELAAQTERHEANIEAQVEQVQSTVAGFEADMDRFFERLLAENDPARLAALAEQAPEPPDLTGDLPSLSTEDDDTTETSAWNDVPWGAAPAPLEADAAAEAEAASTEGLELSSDNVWSGSVLAAARRTLHAPATEFEAAGVANSRLFVNGLTSVAGISAFKGALGQLSGVRSVSVSSGEPGVFIFTVVHDPETDLQDGISGLTSFSARVTDASADGLTVVAQEPAA